MYLRPVHSDLDPEVCHAFVKENPLGVLITHLPISDPSISPLQASHIPFVIDPPPNGFGSLTEGGEGQVKGTLRGHMARANPQTKAILQTASTPATPSTGTSTGVMSYLFGSRPGPESSIQTDNSISELPEDVLIIFNCPIHSYVTPTFYTATKPTTHKVVPTWDYAAVQVYGKLRVYDKGSHASDFLQKQVEDLTKMEEARYLTKCASGSSAKDKEEWEVGMAPVSYVDLLKKGIVGIEVEIKRIEGKFKMSQENEQGDWEGVVDGFKGMGTEEGRKMARMIEQRGKEREVRCKKEEEGLGEDGTDHELSKKSAEEA